MDPCMVSMYCREYPSNMPEYLKIPVKFPPRISVRTSYLANLPDGRLGLLRREPNHLPTQSPCSDSIPVGQPQSCKNMTNSFEF